MVKLNENLLVGDRNNITPEYLLFLIETFYRDIVEQLNQKPSVYFRPNNGLSTDYIFSDGDININTITHQVDQLVEHNTSTTVTWVTLFP